MSNPTPLTGLFADYASGTIDSGSLQQLENALRSDADLRREFVEYLNLDSALGDIAALSNAELREIDTLPLPRQADRAAPRDRSRSQFRLLGIAAAAVLFAVVWSLRTSDSAPSAGVVAVQVISESDASIVGVNRVIRAGHRLELSQLSLTSGTVRLRLPTGVELDLFAPLDGIFESQSRLRLDRGRLNADVADSGHGFTVITGAGEIVDLGTRFGVDVSGSEAKVAVFEGEVAFNPNLSDIPDGQKHRSEPLRILEGEGVRLQTGRRPERLSTIRVTGQDLRFSPPGAASIVTEVTDNADASDFRRFYGVVAGGMSDGTIAYTTMASQPRRDIVWRSMPGESFPAVLSGSDVVCSFHTDRLEQALTISLHLSQPATVFVMHDRRRPPPRWLQTEFNDTGQKIRSGPWRPVSPVSRGITPDPDGDIFVEYSIWKKDVKSGRVDLGAPHAQSDRGNKAMYGIAVKPLAFDR